MYIVSKHDSTLENCYHFWIGYLLPTINFFINNKSLNKNKYIFRDCGAMNPWLIDLVDKDYSIGIVPMEKFLIEALENKNKLIFNEWDNPNKFEEKNISSSIKNFREFYKIQDHSEKNIGILTKKFNKDHKSEFSKMINKERKIKNINNLVSSLSKITKCFEIDTSEKSPKEVIKEYQNIKVLIGQYGAGLTNMIWMPKNSIIVQIKPPSNFYPNKYINCYEILAKAIGHEFIMIEAQQDWDSEVDIDAIFNLIEMKIK